MNGKDMCEQIVAELERRGVNPVPTPQEIWEMSPTGELWPVFELYYSLFPQESFLDNATGLKSGGEVTITGKFR